MNLVSQEQLRLADGDVLLVLHTGAERDGSGELKTREICQQLSAVKSGKVVDLTEDEPQQLYFDRVLAVEPNAELLSRVVRQET